MNGKRLPLKRLQMPGDDAPDVAQAAAEAQMYAYLRRVVVDGEAPAITAQEGTVLAGMVLGVMTDFLGLKLGVTAEQARGAAVGWIIGRAAAAEGNS